MPVIAMTREMGSLGKEVARMAAERLDVTVVHHEVLDPAEERAAYETEVTRFLEGPDAGPVNARELPFGSALKPTEIYRLVERGNVLIRGWGAARLLKGLSQVLSVRVCSTLDRRISEMQRRLGVDAGTAESEIRRSDASHAKRVFMLFEEDWRSPDHYDLVLNTADLSVESCASIVVDAALGLTETEEARAALAERLLEARIAEVLQAPPLRRRYANVSCSVDRDRVRLFGAVSDGTASQAIEAAVRALPSVAEVTNEIQRIGRYADT